MKNASSFEPIVSRNARELHVGPSWSGVGVCNVKVKPRIFTEQSNYRTYAWNQFTKISHYEFLFSLLLLPTKLSGFSPNRKRGIMVKLKILRLNLGVPELIDQRHRNFTSSQTTNYTDFLKLTSNVYNTEAQVLRSLPVPGVPIVRTTAQINMSMKNSLGAGRRWGRHSLLFPSPSLPPAPNPPPPSPPPPPLCDFASPGNISTPRTG